MKRVLWIALLSIVSANTYASDTTLDLSVAGNNQKLILKVKTQSATQNPSEGKSAKHLMGVDSLAGGSPDDIWQRVQSDRQEIYVMTNGRYFTTKRYSGHFLSGDGKTRKEEDTLKERLVYGFATYIVTNLPESTIVGAPQSVMTSVEGDCEARHYHVLGTLSFAGKNRSGMAMESTQPEDVERKLVPNSLFEKAFNMLCKIATEQK